MSALSREDVLRELELLPVWQLRQPLPEVAKPKSNHIGIKEIAAENKPATIATQMLRHVVSDDGRWLFVFENHMPSADEAALFNNLLRAMQVQSQSPVQTENTLDLVKANNIRWVVAMGETVAQALLQSTEKLTSLRGQLHPFQTAHLITTFNLQHLLLHPQDKAHTWADICLAMQAQAVQHS